ncbi:MAG: DUF86 domain-containing protein [Chloroflexi bacterium]|nr:DUF86 domain-containing protein [Chloroflexota bacterium]
MQMDDEIRLRHMLDAAREARSFIVGRKRADLNQDRVLVLALVKSVEIVGEAAFTMSETTKEMSPNIPWADIIGMRHRLVHAYFDINLDVLWQTVQNDLPTLIAQINPLVPPDKSS